MSLEYIFPDHTARNRHIAIVVEIFVAIIALIFIIYAGMKYWPKSQVSEVKDKQLVDNTKSRQELVSMPNPLSELSSTEIKSRQEIVSQPNPVEKISTDERRVRQSLIENI